MARARLLLMDACVLIDFATIDASLLMHTSRHVGDVYIASPVLGLAKQLDERKAASLGIKLFEPTLKMVFTAATSRGRLSFEDRLSVIVAKAKGWTSVSNDRQLRAHCKAESVSVMWGFDVLARLVDARALSPQTARNLGKKFAASNRRIGRQVLLRFLARIGVKE